ncbi:MAG: PqqD family protein [Gemmatimonadetes bacterium]|nr:PqqD family protein [Gemmatimonadota bacterium]
MSAVALTRATPIVASDDQASAELSSEVVILSMREGVYFGLDGVGARIWSLVQQPTTLGEVTATIVSEFEVEEERAFADLCALAGEMAGHGLVRLGGETGTT